MTNEEIRNYVETDRNINNLSARMIIERFSLLVDTWKREYNWIDYSALFALFFNRIANRGRETQT